MNASSRTANTVAISSAFDLHLMAEGSHWQLYDKLGAHPCEIDGICGVAFAVWAPNATRVSVVGDFNQWDGTKHKMYLRPEAGIWELFIPQLVPGLIYKFEIADRDGYLLPLKADPFAFECERPPDTASRVTPVLDYAWTDQAWIGGRSHDDARARPLSIYECHLASWARVAEEGGRYLTYDELAARLIPYVQDLGFTHIELMPVSEYPFDGSWGYQPTGLFAPTSRFGSPEAFARFVDQCHAHGLGLILDWVPGHFPNDPHGLACFDGTHLYEHADPRLGFHQDWNTLIYNYGRREVENFLLSNALYWIERFHIDGLRVDAVASMLYLDYSRKPGEWIPNRFGGRENLEAVAFLRKLNELVRIRHPGVLTIAEESTAWPGVTRALEEDGLGFSFKWNMGWMHDTLRYISHDPLHRAWHQDDLTFGLVYAFSENFILPLSHDEVVHGKGSLIHKMPGDEWQRFANLRAYLAFMFAHPGKKLLFMGMEFAQEREWNHDRALDWHLLQNPLNLGVQNLVRDLNGVYRLLPALHEKDCDVSGFSWLDYSDRAQSVIAFLRHSEGHCVVVLCNFTPVPRDAYRIGVPMAGYYRERINSDAQIYGGSNLGNAGGALAQGVPSHGHPFSLTLTLPPLSTLILEHVPQ